MLIMLPGRLSIALPPYLSFEHNANIRKASLNVQDRKIREQREMWGRFPLSYGYYTI